MRARERASSLDTSTVSPTSAWWACSWPMATTRQASAIRTFMEVSPRGIDEGEQAAATWTSLRQGGEASGGQRVQHRGERHRVADVDVDVLQGDQAAGAGGAA